MSRTAALPALPVADMLCGRRLGPNHGPQPQSRICASLVLHVDILVLCGSVSRCPSIVFADRLGGGDSRERCALLTDD